MMLSLLFVFGFVVGVVTIIALEALGVIVVIKRLNKKARQEETAAKESKGKTVQLDPHQSLSLAYEKKGVIWILEPDKIPKILPLDKLSKDQKRKKELFEVSPVQKYAKIKYQSLILTESDGSNIGIPLQGCRIEAVSATSLSSRKWAKRFPLKLESQTSIVYKGSRTVYIYLETSWEKESWCKALRLASCNDKERLNWISNLNEEFHAYLTSIQTGYYSVMKPAAGFSSEPAERTNRIDGSSSKVRLFWKKFSRKAFRAGAENKASWTSSSGREERKIIERFLPHKDSVSVSGSTKNVAVTKALNNILEDNVTSPFSTFTRSGSQSSISVISDANSEKFNSDEGTLCWNLLMSRLFFDVKNNKDEKNSIQARIQRTLSTMRIPSYVGEVTCTDIHLGNLPPYIHGMRVLPTDMNEVWALEVDIEYSGGLLLDVETRLEVCELDIQKGLIDANSESSSVADVSSDLLEGFEQFEKQLNISEGTVDAVDQKDEVEQDGLKKSKSATPASTSGSRWKSIVNNIAKQVSQVPLSLSIRVSSFRGTLRLHIKPPPSDQLWYGFTSVPDIDFKLESSVGDHKISSARIAVFLTTRFKAAIRETLVLPNCESVCIPWMLAEKNDWAPARVAPYIWVRHEAVSHESHGSQPDEMKTKMDAGKGTSSDHPGSKHKKSENSECKRHPNSESLDAVTHLPSSSNPSIHNSMSAQDLRTPLSGTDKPPHETCHQNREVMEHVSLSRSFTSSDGENHTIEEDDAKQRKMGRRARMFDLGKKMGEKLEQKKRDFEEKGRNMVEKMRGP